MIFAALMLLDALTLWAIISSKKGWWWLKALAIVVAVVFNFFTLSAFNSGDGWPIKALPQDAAFIGCDVVEPDPVNNTPGAIYIFAVPTKHIHNVIGYSSSDQAPRTYQEPYTRQLHEQCQQAQKRAKQGVQQLVGVKEHSKYHGHTQKGKLVFYKLPPSHIPKKNR